MKKKIVIALALVVVMIFTFAMPVFAKSDLVRLVEKDGLKAELELVTNESSPELTDVKLKLTKDSDSKVLGIKAQLEFKGAMYRLKEGYLQMSADVAAGESGEIKWVLLNRDVESQKSEGSMEESSKNEEKQDGGIIKTIVTAVLAVVIICVVLVLVKKSKNGTKAMLLLGAILLSSFAFTLPAKADDGFVVIKKMELVDYIKYNDKDYEVKVKIEYEYTISEEEIMSVKGMKGFDITYYWGPHGLQMIDEEFIKKIAEAGFTSIPLEGNATMYNKIALELLEKYGLTCSALGDSRITQLVDMTNPTQEAIDKVVSEVVEDYKDYKNIKGWLIRDEPGASKFEVLSQIVHAFKKYDPERTTMINLFPTYANDEQLGTQGYQAYLDQFVDIVAPHYLSYDHYHFLKDGSARYGYFMNLEYVRDKALASDLDPMQIILLTEHMVYADLSFDQIEWEVNTSLTYGMKRISYFTFILDQNLLDEGWDNACMSYTGEIYPHYYDVQKINKWLLPLGTELFDKESVGVYHIKKNAGEELEEECEEYTGFGDLGAVNAANFVVGFFDDGSFMITDKYYDKNEKENNTFEFIDIKSGLEYFDTETATWKDALSDGVVTENANGNLEKVFDTAEGMLFRVVK